MGRINMQGLDTCGVAEEDASIQKEEKRGFGRV